MAGGKQQRRSRKQVSTTSSLATAAASGAHAIAESVATLLMIEQGLRQSGIDVGTLGDLFDIETSVVIIRADTRGFVDSAKRLLEAGAILPGRAQTVEIEYIRPVGHVRFTDAADVRWRIVSMLCESDSVGQESEDETVLRDRMAHTARAGHPLLVIAETDRIPSLLTLAADRVLDAGRLDAPIIARTAALIAGHDEADVQSAIVNASLDPARLSLGDLSLAIRPSVPIDRMIAVLTHLARRDDEGEGGDTAPATSGPWSNRSQGDRDWDRPPTSLSASTRDRQRISKRTAPVPSASEIIQPLASGGSQRLRVETLSGYGAAQGWALDLKADLDLWRSGTLPWDQLSSRLLLSGPPGTGKTTFARALCNSLELPLHVTSVSTWLEASYLGDVIKLMNAAFSEARRHAPSILFIDECDGIGKRQPQNRSHADYWNALVNKMLELLDGAAKSEGVIIVGATNRPEAMDEALKRSGRWERQIVIPMPDRAALIGILAHHLGEDCEAGVKTAPGASHTVTSALDNLARRAVGLSGADIERLVREARGHARRQGRSLTYADLDAGLAHRRVRRSRDVRYRMAVHEAGHAVVRRALKLGTEVALTIEDPGGGYAEAMLDMDIVQSSDWVTALIAAQLGGRAAEAVVFGAVTAGSGGSATSDLANATRLALSMEIELGFGSSLPLLHRSMEAAELLLLNDGPLSAAVHARLEAAFDLATRTIAADRASLLRLADALTEAGSLNAAEIAAVFATGTTRQSREPDASG
ncbi:AAA family ATPase [Aurantimonas coralicida]|uniref:AAA family ATPase n=1 Tax=Aurantimonas coralicida TaxID=182270 RepID=UPI001E341C50|nr:AAA family ATPase [Aurantimonas coralicida]MCD1642595.1 AAA family ATPase [Aurantimonas coralicida]